MLIPVVFSFASLVSRCDSSMSTNASTSNVAAMTAPIFVMRPQCLTCVSAKLNGLNQRAYPEWLLTEMPNEPIVDAEALAAALESSDSITTAVQ